MDTAVVPPIIQLAFFLFRNPQALRGVLVKRIFLDNIPFPRISLLFILCRLFDTGLVQKFHDCRLPLFLCGLGYGILGSPDNIPGRACVCQNLVSGGDILHFFQLIQVFKRQLETIACLFFPEDVLIEFCDIQAAANRGSAEPGLLRYLLFGLSQVKHHLKTACLFPDSQIGALHVLFQHG